MGLADSFLKIALGLGIISLTAGTVAAPLTGSSKSFEFAPVWSAAIALKESLTNAAQHTHDDRGTSPAPIAQVAKAVGDRALSELQRSAANIPAFQADPRLSVCPRGSIDPTSIEVPRTLANRFKSQAEKESFSSLVEVQGSLDIPVCNFHKGKAIQWRYLVKGGGIIEAIEQGNKVTFRFTNL